MSFEVIGLGKLLGAMYAAKPRKISVLRGDIRAQIKKDEGLSEDGGDFHIPFWADAKRHVSGELNLRAATKDQIKSHKGRARLYPILADGFLLWWEEKRRMRNVPFKIIEENIKARYPVSGAGIVKVENTLSITVGEDGHRVIYPYFCEQPALSEEAARLGLWAMSQCVKGYDLENMRVLDVIRGRSFSTLDTPLLGNEEAIFIKKYKELLHEWKVLREEYA